MPGIRESRLAYALATGKISKRHTGTAIGYGSGWLLWCPK